MKGYRSGWTCGPALLFLVLSVRFFPGEVLTAHRGEPAGYSATPYAHAQEPTRGRASWDLVVLGQIDACWVCQHGLPPHVSYSRVLAGVPPSGRAQGTLSLVEIPVRLLPPGGIPIYRSQRPEICYLEIVGQPGDKEPFYRVVDIEEATRENL